jgi:hypothetical protein
MFTECHSFGAKIAQLRNSHDTPFVHRGTIYFARAAMNDLSELPIDRDT